MNGKVKVGVNCAECYEVVDLGWFYPEIVSDMATMFPNTVCSRCLGRWVRASMEVDA